MPRPYGLLGNNGTYGRVMGLGTVPCSDIHLPAGFVGPVDCDPTNGGPVYPVSQDQISAIWQYITDGSVSSTGESIAPTAAENANTLGAMLQKNWPYLLLGIGAVLLIKGR